jgi:hypothetical protein
MMLLVSCMAGFLLFLSKDLRRAKLADQGLDLRILSNLRRVLFKKQLGFIKLSADPAFDLEWGGSGEEELTRLDDVAMSDELTQMLRVVAQLACGSHDRVWVFFTKVRTSGLAGAPTQVLQVIQVLKGHTEALSCLAKR